MFDEMPHSKKHKLSFKIHLAKGLSGDTTFGIESFESGMIVIRFFDLNFGDFGFDFRFISVGT